MDTETAGEYQLTIRIPSPKIHMTRQSHWTGHRRKLRCDHCRERNLKCDRAIPTCGNCAAKNSECSYTVPAHSHRGIPRCVACQKNNLKCDRDSPTCNQCQLHATPCSYRPRRRKKGDGTEAFNEDADQDINFSIDSLAASLAENDGNTGEEVSKSHLPTRQQTSKDIDAEDSSKSVLVLQPKSVSSDRGSSSLHSRSHSRSLMNDQDGPSSGRVTSSSRSSSASASSRSHEQAAAIPDSESFVEPWSHPAFAPLPVLIVRRLAVMNVAEMPDRSVFITNLESFLKMLMPEMQETASLDPHAYTAVARFLSSGETSPDTSVYLRTWMFSHRLLPGSPICNLILVPRDPIPDNVHAALMEYQSDPDKFTYGDEISLPQKSAFDRLPVRNQLYDILAYAHREHNGASAVVDEVRALGFISITWPMADMFVRLCPLCCSDG